MWAEIRQAAAQVKPRATDVDDKVRCLCQASLTNEHQAYRSRLTFHQGVHTHEIRLDLCPVGNFFKVLQLTTPLGGALLLLLSRFSRVRLCDLMDGSGVHRGKDSISILIFLLLFSC